jgi:CTP synthase (UTP-ammonia lyase)
MSVPIRIAVVGDHDPGRETHRLTTRALEHLDGVAAEWVPTQEIDPAATRLAGAGGILVAPGEPYASAEGALAAIRLARERGVPLVGT